MILKETTDAQNSLKSSDHDEIHVVLAVFTDCADYFITFGKLNFLDLFAQLWHLQYK